MEKDLKERVEENLALLGKLNPTLYPYLLVAHETKNKKVKETHSHVEAEFRSLDLCGKDAIVRVSLGKGLFYESALPWLEEKRTRRLLFLEADVGVILSFLAQKEAKAILLHPQVEIHYIPEEEEKKKHALSLIAWSLTDAKITISTSQNTVEEKALAYALCYDIEMKTSFADEYKNFGIPFYRNFYPNMLTLSKRYSGICFFDQFQKVPAIICGAGPSLAKQIPLLKLVQEKALIFAGGSAINGLIAGGLYPHFGGGIDPNEEQYKRVNSRPKNKIPTFYRNRMHTKALEALEGPRIYVPGSGGYDTAHWIETRLGIVQEEDEIDEGHNVVNFLIGIATRMGCDPIILVGLDLAYTDMKAYTEGVVDDPRVTQKSLQDHAVAYRDIYGQNIFTTWIWITESNWISSFAKEHKENLFLNATEGGIGFAGVENMSLSEVAESYLLTPYLFKERITKVLEGAHFPKDVDGKARSLLLELKESLIRVEGKLNLLLHELEKNYEEAREKPSGLTILYETEIMEEPAYAAILDIFNLVCSYKTDFALQTLITRSEGLQAKERARKILSLQRERFLFLLHVVKANLHLIGV